LQTDGDGPEIGATFGGSDQQVADGGGGLGQAVGGTVLARGSLAVDQGLDVSGVLDLRTFVIAAPMAGQDCTPSTTRSSCGSASTVRVRCTCVWGTE